MKKIYIILFALLLNLSALMAQEDTNTTATQETTQDVLQGETDATTLTQETTQDVSQEDTNATATQEQTQTEDANTSVANTQEESDYDVDEDLVTAETEDANKTKSAFEKLFVNHTAYIYYNKALKALFESDYKVAYAHAMNAQKIYDNTDNNASQVIALPYMPNYLRESAYTPKRIYYKTVKPKPYELRRLITKIKLLSPPIASVVLKRTSTYLEVIIRNYGDLPLDEFELLLNDEPIAKYSKVLPNEQKTTRIESAPTLYELSFKEKYGFAPHSIMLSEGE